MAAIISDRFKLDPIHVLHTGYFDWALRVAATERIGELEKAAANKKGDK